MKKDLTKKLTSENDELRAENKVLKRHLIRLQKDYKLQTKLLDDANKKLNDLLTLKNNG